MSVLATSRSGSTDLSITVHRDDYAQVFRLVQDAARLKVASPGRTTPSRFRDRATDESASGPTLYAYLHTELAEIRGSPDVSNLRQTVDFRLDSCGR